MSHYNQGRQAEKRFRELTGAIDADKSLESQHIDCFLRGFSVDVKGLRKSHTRGYVLVEFVNVAGNHGWCSRGSGADFIAFEFDEGFYMVGTMNLYDLAKSKLVTSEVRRESGVSYEDGLYKLIGRTKWRGKDRKDVFTYITKEDLLSIRYKFYAKEELD